MEESTRDAVRAGAEGGGRGDSGEGGKFAYCAVLEVADVGVTGRELGADVGPRGLGTARGLVAGE